MKNNTLLVLGATGLIGGVVRKVLEEEKLNISTYYFASKKGGRKIDFMGKEYEVLEATEEMFEKLKPTYCIFCAGGEASKKYVKAAVDAGSIVIDNSSAFRMEKDVPLVVPEVNSEDIQKHSGIIANPNCSTAQAMLPLKVIDDLFGIKRIVYSTYQAVSGAGQAGIEDYLDGLKGGENKKFVYQIVGNCIPHIDVFMENGYTKEEMKLIEETKKILHRPDIKVTATAVRVPVLSAHSESINVECERKIDLELLKTKLKEAKGIILQDDPEKNIYPIATNAQGKNEVFVGRLRIDNSIENGLDFWCVSDNTRKGAATNAVQILKELLK